MVAMDTAAQVHQQHKEEALVNDRMLVQEYTSEQITDILDAAIPQTSEWIAWSDQESTSKIKDYADLLRRFSGRVSFSELQKRTISVLGAMTAIEAVKQLQSPSGEKVSTDFVHSSYTEMDADFMRAIRGAFDGFAGEDGKVADPSKESFKQGIDTASHTAADVLARRFARPGETPAQTASRLIDWIAQIRNQDELDFFVQKREPIVPATVDATPAEWKKFLVYVFMLPNAAWMSGIFARTIAGQDVNTKEPGVQLATTKSNVGTYGYMISAFSKEEDLLFSLNYDKKEVVRWLTEMTKEVPIPATPERV